MGPILVKRKTVFTKRPFLFKAYVFGLLLLVALPINGEASPLNNIYLLSLRVDHLLHGMIFFPWAAFFVLTRGKNQTSQALFSGLLAALLLEGLQYLLPYRSFNVNDMLANVIGVLVGMGSWGIFLWLRRNRGRSLFSSPMA